MQKEALRVRHSEATAARCGPPSAWGLTGITNSDIISSDKLNMGTADDDHHVALERAFALLTKALGEIEGDFLGTLAKGGLTEGLLGYLDRIAELGAPSLGKLAASLEVSLPSASVAVKKLRGKGLVSASRDLEDRRAVTLAVTARGRSVVAAHAATHHEMAERFRRALSAEDVAALEAIVRRVLGAVPEG